MQAPTVPEPPGPGSPSPRQLDDDTAGSGSLATRLDPAALGHVLRRLGRSPEAPWLHAEIARRMADKLQLVLRQPETVIDWWSTLGGGAALLAQAYPKARRVLVEPDTAWAERARERLRSPWWSARRWSSAPALVVEEGDDVPGGAGLVWANMMLHAVADPAALIGRWQRLLRADGFVMFSCLGPGTMRELRALYERSGWAQPMSGYVDMHDYGDMLVRAGFADPVMDQEVLTLSWSTPQALLDDLRALGGNLAPGRHAGLRTPRWRDRLAHELATLADADGVLRMSIEVAYGHAFQGAPRVQPGEATSISLEDMRAMVRSGHGAAGSPRRLR